MARNYSKKNVLTAIEGSSGIVNNVATALDCNWHTAQRYINKWESAKKLFSSETEKIIDNAESKLYAAIDDGDVSCIKYILSTKGKHRGYSEKVEMEHTVVDIDKIKESLMKKLSN